MIKKTVVGIVYYWNDHYKRWEGLEDNASIMESSRMEQLMARWLQRSNAHEYSFFKI